MRSLDLWKIAAQNVWYGRSKSLLCILALCIGICSVCTVLCFGNLAADAVAREIDQTGLGGLACYPKNDTAISIEEEDLQLAAKTEGVAAVMPLAIRTGTVSLHGTSISSAICGVDEALKDVFSLTLLDGRLLKKQDIAGGEAVVVVDDALAQSLYRRTNISGKHIRLTLSGITESFEIIGVVASQKQGIQELVGGKIPSFLYIPHTKMDQICGEKTTDTLAVSCFPDYNSDSVGETLTQKLSYINDTTFRYENLTQYTESFKNIAHVVSLLATSVAAISIVVGGLGVMNSMTAAVESRIGEIGIYMAIGARKTDILRCFLLESLILCGIGGISGVTISMLIFQIVVRLLKLSLIFQYQYLYYGLAMAAVCGITFGLLPALKAVRLNPIDAIRTDS